MYAVPRDVTAVVVNVHDVRVAYRCERARFADELRAGVLVFRDVRGENLERHALAHPEVLRLVSAGSRGAEAPHDVELAVEMFPDQLVGRG